VDEGNPFLMDMSINYSTLAFKVIELKSRLIRSYNNELSGIKEVHASQSP